MRTLVVIPARLGATRLQQKPLRDLAGRPLVVRVWERVNGMKLGDACVVATDDEVCGAVAWAARTLKLVVEPGGAVGLACVRNAQLPTQGRTVVVVLTGGNIDMPVLQSILTVAQGSAA